jgi:hypothetical protein
MLPFLLRCLACFVAAVHERGGRARLRTRAPRQRWHLVSAVFGCAHFTSGPPKYLWACPVRSARREARGRAQEA